MIPSLAFIEDDATPHELTGGSVVVIGNFDGIHLGHRAVLGGAVEEAKARGVRPLVLTFQPHPAGVLGRVPPPMLTTVERRAELMARLGVWRVYVRPFDLAFASWSPQRFAEELLAKALRAQVVVVGDNFRFGVKRSGDFATLTALGKQLGFEARAHAMASDARGVYSSTRVREALRAGNLDEVTFVLGRPHALSGVVEHGQKRGRTIGFPTANLGQVPELLPPDGVYAIYADAQDDAGTSTPLAGGVMNVGMRPTVDGGAHRTVEAHLFDLTRDLYGARLRVHLVQRLRDEQKFDGLDALRAQIARDADAARAALTAFPRAKLDT